MIDTFDAIKIKLPRKVSLDDLEDLAKGLLVYAINHYKEQLGIL
jgi:hypothetical protein